MTNTKAIEIQGAYGAYFKPLPEIMDLFGEPNIDCLKIHAILLKNATSSDEFMQIKNQMYLMAFDKKKEYNNHLKKVRCALFETDKKLLEVQSSLDKAEIRMKAISPTDKTSRSKQANIIVNLKGTIYDIMKSKSEITYIFPHEEELQALRTRISNVINFFDVIYRNVVSPKRSSPNRIQVSPSSQSYEGSVSEIQDALSISGSPLMTLLPMPFPQVAEGVPRLEFLRKNMPHLFVSDRDFNQSEVFEAVFNASPFYNLLLNLKTRGASVFVEACNLLSNIHYVSDKPRCSAFLENDSSDDDDGITVDVVRARRNLIISSAFNELYNETFG
jgi:hypothetical protein